jgi:hypothetical protein
VETDRPACHGHATADELGDMELLLTVEPRPSRVLVGPTTYAVLRKLLPRRAWGLAPDPALGLPRVTLFGCPLELWPGMAPGFTIVR